MEERAREMEKQGTLNKKQELINPSQSKNPGREQGDWNTYNQ